MSDAREVPRRIQRSRAKGSRLPPNTICCSRPGPYGNAFSADVGTWQAAFRAVWLGFRGDRAGQIKASIWMYEQWLTGGWKSVERTECPWFSGQVLTLKVPSMPPTLEQIRAALAGSNLACWCHLCPDHADGKPLDVTCAVCAPCHLDVLGVLIYAPAIGGADV